MIEHQLSPESAAALADAARASRRIYRDGLAFERLLQRSKAALEVADPEAVALVQRFAAGTVPNGAIMFHGAHVDEETLGPTPAGWELGHQNEQRDPVTEAALLGFAAAAGDVFAFARQHAGALIQNVAPVRDHEFEAVGTGSRGLLDWHTEDAFDGARPDYVALICLRGDVRAQTALAPLDGMDLDDADAAVLRQARFMHGIDKASGGNGRPEDGVRGPILTEGPSGLEIGLDMDCVAAVAGDHVAAAALGRLHDAANRAGIYVTLRRGDVLLFDNRRVLHARTSFTPRYDGTDRWLQRVIISSDLAPAAERCTRRHRVIENEPIAA